MTTVQEQVEELAKKFAMSEINKLDFAIYKRTTKISKITVEFLNRFMATKIKYPEYSRASIAKQMIHDYPDTAVIIFKKTDSAGHGMPIDELENVNKYCDRHNQEEGAKYIADRLTSIDRLALVDVTTMDQARWHILNGNLGKLVNGEKRAKYIAIDSAKRKGL